MLENARVTAFTVSELLRENHQREGKITPPPTQTRLKFLFSRENNHFLIICKQSSLRGD